MTSSFGFEGLWQGLVCYVQQVINKCLLTIMKKLEYLRGFFERMKQKPTNGSLAKRYRKHA